MTLQSALPRGRGRWWAAAIAGACVAAVAIGIATSNSRATGARAPLARVTTASLATFRTAIIARMHAQQLNYTWVDCVHSGGRFQGVPVVRCNVDFGIDPHVMAYCSVFRGGQLLTSAEDPAIPCGHDDAGYTDTLITYG